MERSPADGLGDQDAAGNPVHGTGDSGGRENATRSPSAPGADVGPEQDPRVGRARVDALMLDEMQKTELARGLTAVLRRQDSDVPEAATGTEPDP